MGDMALGGDGKFEFALERLNFFLGFGETTEDGIERVVWCGVGLVCNFPAALNEFVEGRQVYADLFAGNGGCGVWH